MLPKLKTYIILFYLLFVLALPAYAQSPPSFSKSFSPNTIGPGSVSTLTFDITNSDASPVTDLAFTDNLPAGVTIATPANTTSTCDGTLTALDGGSTITLTGGSVGASSTCSITVDVTSSTVGTHMNVSGDLTSSAGNSGTASANLTVTTARPGFSKAFSPNSVFFGERTTLTFTVDNTANGSNAFLLAFTDNLPTGMLVADPPNVSTTCTGGTVTAEAGTDLISYSSGSVNAGSSCTLSVDVVATSLGTLANTSGELSSTPGGPSVSSGKANAALTVTRTDVVLNKSFAGDPLSPGSTVPLVFSITNFDRNFSATNIAFTDDLDGTLSGLVATGLPQTNVCGAGSQLTGTSLLSLTGGTLAADGGTCTFTVTLQIPAGATPGAYPNTTSSLTADLGGTPGTHNPASEKLFIEPGPLLTKSFASSTVSAGDTVTLNFNITNTSSTSAATDIAFQDNLSAFMSGAQVMTSLPAIGVCGGGSVLSAALLSGELFLIMTGGNLVASGSCNFSIDLLIPTDQSNGTYPNTTTRATATVNGETVTGTAGSDTLTVVAPPLLGKTFIDDPVIPGDTVELEFRLVLDENAPTNATNIAFTDDLNATLTGLTATGLPQTNICGTGSQIAGTTSLSFTGGTLAADTTCVFTVTLQVPAGATLGDHTNTTSSITANVGGMAVTGNQAADDLTLLDFGFTKSFTDDPVLPGGTATLEFTLVNSNTVSTATNIIFSDSLGSALSGLASTSGTLTNICGTGSQLAGSTSLLFTNGELDPGASCTFSVTVQIPGGAAEGTYNNTTSSLSFQVGGSTFSAPPANDALEVQQNVLFLSKNFGSSSALIGDNVTLVFTLTNSFAGAATGIAFTDDLDAALSGLSATGLPANNVCGTGSQLTGTTLLSLTGGNLAAGASCVFSVTLQIPGSAAAGDYTNTTSGVTGSIGGLPVTGNTASADLQLIDPATLGQIVVDKVTDPAGDPTSFDFTLSGSPIRFSQVTFSLTDSAAPVTTTVEADGVYTISETVPTDWTLTGSSCSDGSSIDNINVGSGETVTCIITNTYTPIVVYNSYLPIILKDAAFLPDLVIDNFVVNSNQVTIMIRNAGVATIPVGDEFWVQIVFGTAPTGVNQRWDTLSSQGALWGVVSPAVPLVPNATLTLTLNDTYYYNGNPPGGPANNIPSPIPVGTTVYAQVDAIDFSTTYGVVLEGNENNNIASTVSIAGSSTIRPVGSNPPDSSTLVGLPGLGN